MAGRTSTIKIKLSGKGTRVSLRKKSQEIVKGHNCQNLKRTYVTSTIKIKSF